MDCGGAGKIKIAAMQFSYSIISGLDLVSLCSVAILKVTTRCYSLNCPCGWRRKEGEDEDDLESIANGAYVVGD